MSASAPYAKTPPLKEPPGSETPEAASDTSPTPPRWPLWARWALRLTVVSAILSAIGYFSDPAGSIPLLCKIYG
ncbi:MAG: hypothetical protein EG825_11805 [Rhodocyclaceae bacterium]|nr:hypothetical protein [Rhodocyclaceae bacterium]